MCSKLLKRFLTEEAGQGVTEYGAILAFIAFIVSIVFSLRGSYQVAMTNAFSTVAAQLNSVASGGGS